MLENLVTFAIKLSVCLTPSELPFFPFIRSGSEPRLALPTVLVFSQLSTSPSHQLTLHRQALCDPVLFDLVTVAILETTSTPLPRP